MVSKICINCGSDKTYVQKSTGNEHWYNHNDKWYCEKCNNRLFKNREWHPINNPKRHTYKNQTIQLSINPRTGICSRCGKKIGDKYIGYRGKLKMVTQTDLHHIEYHDDDTLRDTIELCHSCHTKITIMELKQKK